MRKQPRTRTGRASVAARVASTLIVAFAVVPTGALAQQQQQQEPKDDSSEGPVEEIVVVGTKQSRYVVDTTDAATRIDLDFLDNPRNVTVIPEQLVLDRKITTIEEALRNAPGVVAGDGFGGTRDDFFIRGFRRNAEYRNGFRRATNFKANLSNIDFTQVIRGPASITYGQVEPGGVVDVVTKKPLQEQRLSGELRYGSFSNVFGLIDVSLPIGDRAGVRVVGSVQDAESFRDFTDINRDTIAISSRFDVTDATRLDLAYEWRNEGRPLDRGTLTVGLPDGSLAIVNDLLDIPFERRFGDPFEAFEVDFQIFEAALAHDLTENWNVQLGMAYEDSIADDLQSRPLQVFVADATDLRIDDDGFVAAGIDGPALVNELRSNPYDDATDRVFLQKQLDGSRGRDSQFFHANFFVRGDFATGLLTHRVVFGADYRDGDTTRRFVRGAATDGVDEPYFNLQQPAYLLSDQFSLDGVAIDKFGGTDKGFFANSYTEFNDRLGVLLGIRYNETSSFMRLPGFSLFRESASDGWSPQLGVTFKALDTVSLYASYSESFEPNNSLPEAGGAFRPIDPEEGEQLEFGAKAEFFAERAQAGAAFYRIDKVNVFSGTDVNGNPIFEDGQRSEGVELTFAGQPVPGMNVTTSYAYIDAALSNGNRPASVPENVFNVYASYEVQDGRYEGLGFGGGYYYESDRFGNSGNTFELGDISLVDASVWYTIPAAALGRPDGTIRFQLAVKNLLDEAYFVGTSSQMRIPLGTPRTVFASVSAEF